MKKKTLTKTLTIVLTSLLLSGCSKPEVNSELPKDTTLTQEETKDSTQIIDDLGNERIGDTTQTPDTEPKNQGITVNQIAFEVVDETTLSQEQLTEIESLKLTRGYTYWLQEDGSYLIFIGAGEKPTGGYTITVTSIEDNEGKTNIFVEEAPPADNVRVMQVITYPYVIIKASGITDQFNITDQDQVAYDLIVTDNLGNSDANTNDDVQDMEGSGIGDTMLAEENPIDYSNPIKGIYQGQVDNHSIEVLVGDRYLVFNADEIENYLEGLEKGDTVELTASISPADQLMLDSIIEIK